jgi:pilus assembly protein Flp/PilA
MLTRLRRLCADSKGATAIEYGLIVALIVLAMMASLQMFASSSIAMWSDVETKVTNP